MRPTLELVALFSLRPHKEVDQVEEKKGFFMIFVSGFIDSQAFSNFTDRQIWLRDHQACRS